MSGGVRTFKLANGGYADVPDDALDDFMQTMDRIGIDFRDANVTADMQVGEPTVEKQTLQTVDLPNDPTEHPPSMAERFLEGTNDAVMGFERGLTMGYGDKAIAGARGLFNDRSYAQNYGDVLAEHRAAEARSPRAYGTAKTIGGAPWDFGAAVLGAPAGPAGNIVTSALLGDIRGAGMSESPTLEGTLQDANKGALEGAAWGVGGELLGGALGAGSRALTKAAPRAREVALGEIGAAARAQRKLKGDEYVENLPAAADELGLTPKVPFDPMHPIDSLKAKLTFKKPGDYATQARELNANEYGPRKGAAVAQATAEGVSAPRQGLIDDLKAAIDEQPANFKRDPYAAAMTRNMTDVPDTPRMTGVEDGGDFVAEPQLTATQLDDLKQGWAKAGYKGPDEVQTVSEGIPATASRDASRAAKRQLHSAIEDMATPETAQEFFDTNDAYEKLSSIGNMAGERQLGLDTQGPFSLAGAMPRLGSIGGGAYLGGQMAGLPGAIVGGAAGYMANKGMQNYGPDALADFLRSSRPGRDAAAFGTLGAAIGGAPGAAVGAGLGALGAPGAQAGARTGNMMTSARDRGTPDADRGAESSRGYLMSEAATQLLQQDPQALGQYASALADAYNDPEPSALSTMLIKLSRTDPTFRTQILPVLRARTQGDF